MISSNFEVGYLTSEIMFDFKSQEFSAKNPGIAFNNEDIIIECILIDDGYDCKVSVDGNHAFTQHFKFNGIAELQILAKKFKFNSNSDMKFTVETAQAEVKLSPKVN